MSYYYSDYYLNKQNSYYQQSVNRAYGYSNQQYPNSITSTYQNQSYQNRSTSAIKQVPVPSYSQSSNVYTKYPNSQYPSQQESKYQQSYSYNQNSRAVESRKNQSRKCGLNNLGNTCYMNAALQCIFNTPQLLEALIEISMKYPLKGLTEEFVKLSILIKDNDSMYKSERPTYLKKEIELLNPLFRGYQQQDSQEFLLFLLEGLHNQLNKGNPKIKIKEFDTILKNNNILELANKFITNSKSREDSIINEFFQGFFLSTVKCQCRSESITLDSFMDISLSFPKEEKGFTSYFTSSSSSLIDITTLFKNFIEIEEHIENYTCSQCRRKCTVSKQISLWSLPKVLIIHLKRFQQLYRTREKIDRKVSFPMALNMQPYLYKDSPLRKEKQIYELQAMVNHSGTTNYGHYTAQCKNPIDETWNEFNDISCKEIDISREDYDNRGSDLPYILFYSKRSNE